MAAGSAFTLVPNDVIPMAPEYNNVQSQTESMKKEYFNISATGVQKYKLNFKALDNTDFSTLFTHYSDQSGGYYPFPWQSVPSYIGSGANITGRWVDGSLEIGQVSNKWKCSIIFEKAN